ncbi:MAG: flavodoxin domain-containing protein [Candidatus Lokiarchaeota archaeon]|nr:flavodoxin domain-containing protein [Candidatus Lokiarchaeota archaeon]
MKKVLIVFGSRYGTTENTSKMISDALSSKNLEVNLVNIKDMEPSVEGYDGVLIGTGIKISMWTKRIKKFVKKHKRIFNNRNFKFGFFISCGTACKKEDVNEAIEKYIKSKMSKIGVTYDLCDAFGAIYDFSETSLLSNMAKKMMKEGLIDDGWEKIEDISYDLRDVNQIQKFSENFASIL